MLGKFVFKSISPKKECLMKNVCLAVSASLAGLLAAALPMAAQASDLLKELAYPPLRHVATPAGGPTGFGPVHLLQAYGFRDVRNKGGGQVIALVDAFDDPTAEADLGTFSTQFGLPACTTANGCFKLVYGGGKKPPADTSGWSNEIAIDIEWAHAVAPSATIMLVEAQSNSFDDLFAAVDAAVQNGANEVSMSWGGSESSDESQSDTHFNVPGVVFTVASGDGGHGASYPAASPYVVSVGGTSLVLNSNGTYGSETAWSDSGGGLSRFEAEPAYQEGAQTTGKRGIPDVAYDGNPETGVPAYSSHACGECYTGWTQWGGTSIGTPQWAALFARANSLRVDAGKALLTLPQTVLYTVPATDFHDVTSGSNGGCGTDCNAGPGYDFVTGLGTPIAHLLIAALGGS
jgi:subtilase family serine protease